jgi:hypothetical protein
MSTPPAKKTRAKPAGTLPQKFKPRFWEELDSRLALVRKIQRRLSTLEVQTGSDSIQKQMLCQRAVFLTLMIEQWEVEALETQRLDSGRYCGALNSLMGVLRMLGLERHRKTVQSIHDYVEEQQE